MLSVVALLLLGSLHWVGVRELPRVALALALAALACEGGAGGGGAGAAAADRLARRSGATSSTWRRTSWTETATGFAAAWLAFSGLESLGQLAPAAARAAPARDPHRRGAGGGQPGGDRAGVHGHRRRGGAGEPHRPASGAAGGGGAGLRRARPAGGGVADRRRVPAGGRERRLHRLLQRLQGGRRARLPAGGDGRAPQALRHAARGDRRHHGGDGAAGDHDAAASCSRWGRCSRSACSGRTRSPSVSLAVLALAREAARGPVVIDGGRQPGAGRFRG